MNTPKSSDDVMRELNELAKTQGRYLGKAFWEIPRQPGSMLDVPLTPEAEERIRRLDATIARLKQQRAPGPVPEGQQQVCANVQNGATAPPLSTARDVPPAEQPSGSGRESQ
jgi:hypothetical protein